MALRGYAPKYSVFCFKIFLCSCWYSATLPVLTWKRFSQIWYYIPSSYIYCALVCKQIVLCQVDIYFSIEFQIKLEFSNNEYGSTDASNLLALPTKKRQTKIVKEKHEKTRILSKQQRKKLEKIVDKRKKKENVNLFKILCNVI